MKDGWIPVTERMPEEHETSSKVWPYKISDTVLITAEIDGERFTDHGRTYDGEWAPRFDKVLAWMPFPEPYMEDL